MLSLQTPLDFYSLPDDREAALAAIIAQISSARTRYWQRMFGFTHPRIADALLSAHHRGVEVRLLLDHVQSCGHVEAGLVHSMILNGFPATNLCITTSQLHQYMHAKYGAIDGEASVPELESVTDLDPVTCTRSPGGLDSITEVAFASVEEATQAGYPRVIEGSTNWSEAAFRQDNTMLIIPSKALATDFMRRFDAQWRWAMQNEAHYQVAISHQPSAVSH